MEVFFKNYLYISLLFYSRHTISFKFYEFLCQKIEILFEMPYFSYKYVLNFE